MRGLPSVEIYLDSEPENMIPRLALHADYVLEETWNGWGRPIATARAFAVFLDSWRANDPNGEWGYVIEPDGNVVMNYQDDEFPLVGVSDSGEALYDLSGWTWVKPASLENR